MKEAVGEMEEEVHFWQRANCLSVGSPGGAWWAQRVAGQSEHGGGGEGTQQGEGPDRKRPSKWNEEVWLLT